MIGLSDGERQQRREVNPHAEGINRGADVRQRSIRLNNNAMCLGKLEKLGVFRIVIGVEVYLEINIPGAVSVNPCKRPKWMNLVHCGNDLSSLEELVKMFDIEVGYANTPVPPIQHQNVASQL